MEEFRNICEGAASACTIPRNRETDSLVGEHEHEHEHEH
jgi:hypothetical protein